MTCPGCSGRLGGSAGIEGRVGGRVGGHGGPVRGARRTLTGRIGLVGGHAGPGQQAWLAWSAGMEGLMELGGQAGLGRDRQGGVVGVGWVGQERAGPMNGSLRCVCLRSWHVG